MNFCITYIFYQNGRAMPQLSVFYSVPGKDRKLPSEITDNRKLETEPGNNLNTIASKLDIKQDYDDIFSLVKYSVKRVIGKERVGIGLALADLPNVLGAFWEVGGNYIVLNDNIVRAIRIAGKSEQEFNSFVYVILMHEYIHSLGYVDESETRILTAGICAELLPDDHPAHILGNSDPWEIYPFLKMIPRSGDSTIRFVSKFDSDSTSYIA